jgi:hypothetical protein
MGSGLQTWCASLRSAAQVPPYVPAKPGHAWMPEDAYVGVSSVLSDDDACVRPALSKPYSSEPTLKAFISTFRGIVGADKYTESEWGKLRKEIGKQLRVGQGYWMKDLFGALPSSFNKRQLKEFREALRAREQLYNHPSRHDGTSGQTIVANPSYARDWVRYFQDGVMWHRGIQAQTNCYGYALGMPLWEEGRKGWNPGELSGLPEAAATRYTPEKLQRLLESDGAERVHFDPDTSVDVIHGKLSEYQAAGHTVFAAYTLSDHTDYHFLAYHSKGAFPWSHKMGPGIPKVHDSRWSYRRSQHGSYALLDGCFEFSERAPQRDGSLKEIRRSANPKDYAIQDARTAVLYSAESPHVRYEFQGYYVRENPRAECKVDALKKPKKSPVRRFLESIRDTVCRADTGFDHI